MNTHDGYGSDEFFGDQSSGDEYDQEYEYGHEYSHENDGGHGGDSHHGSLSKHENLAQEGQYKNIGYHETFDQFKEVKLQEGFEAGYIRHIEDAQKIGMLLGQCILQDIKMNLKAKTKTKGPGPGSQSQSQLEPQSQYKLKSGSSSSCSPSQGLDADTKTVVDTDLVAYVKKFLERVQNEDSKRIKLSNGGGDVDDADNDVRAVVNHLEQKLGR